MARKYYNNPISAHPIPSQLNQSHLRSSNPIIREYSLDISKEQFNKIYQDIIKEDILNFLLIDIDASPENRFRKNFTPIDITQYLI